MKNSGIGGQAVIEGIMMRNENRYAIAVRKPDQQIAVEVKDSRPLTEKFAWGKYPILRGILSFIDSMTVGIATINYSASFYDDPAEQEETRADEIGKKVLRDKQEAVLMALTILVSVAIAVALFMVLPYFISRLLTKYIASAGLLNLIEGLIRVFIFILYLILISLMKDIHRTFMYHGAEHKCINCIENGMCLTPENVKNSSRYHKRCGTSFLFIVMFISVIFFIFIRVDSTALQILIRILLIPVIAGVSYEVLRWAGRNDNEAVKAVSRPGMWLQKITTREPDMDMIEVAIQAVEAVFDWKTFLKEYYKDAEDPEAEMKAKAEEAALSANIITEADAETRTLKPEEITEETPIENYHTEGSATTGGLYIEEEPAQEQRKGFNNAPGMEQQKEQAAQKTAETGDIPVYLKKQSQEEPENWDDFDVEGKQERRNRKKNRKNRKKK